MTTSVKKRRIRELVVTAGFFSFIFLYFLFFNRYHLLYLEQEQLFRYNLTYVAEFLQNPGGLLEIASAFLVQFFFNPLLATSILTGVLIGIFLLTRKILIHYKLNAMLLQFIPVLLLTAMMSNHNTSFTFITGCAFILLLFSGYLSLHNKTSKYVIGVFGFILCYFLSGGFSIVLLTWIILHELLSGKKVAWFRIALFYVFPGFLIPYLSWQFLFYMSFRDAWFRLLYTGPVPEIFYPAILIYPEQNR